MADRAMTGSLSRGIGTTTTRFRQPTTTRVLADARGAARDEPAVRSSYWAITITLVVVMLGGAELFFRTDVLWQIPLNYLLENRRTDTYTRATWLVHHPPGSGVNEIIVLGSSTARAIIELPRNESQQFLSAVLARPELQLVSLTINGGCYPEHLTLLESAFEHGHHPKAIILFSWPSCLGPYDDTDALLAKRMPVVSSTLADLEGNHRSIDVRIQARLVRVSAVHRYRYMVNTLLRRQGGNLLVGRAPWRTVELDGNGRAAAWKKGPLELDRGHYAQLAALPGKWTPTGPASRQLGALLQLARLHGVPILIIESPWSPPFFDVLGGESDIYFQAMQTLAARGGATYVNPNRSAHLSPELFNDLVHVNHAGARAYLRAVAPELRRIAQAW
jgi:hypothetical protein